MSGAIVIVTKLKAYASLTAIVPAARIKAGKLPLGTLAPAIEVTQVGSIPRNIVSMDPRNVMHTDIIRVKVIVKDGEPTAAGVGYPGLRTVLAHVLAACPQTRGTLNGVIVDSILPEGEGPDLPTDMPDWLSGSRDFMVRWIAP